MGADVDQLNEKYCIPGQISFHQGPGQFVSTVINNRFGSALITLEGAHLMSYHSYQGRELLWTSPSAGYELSPAMRGGFPICWPWFGKHPQYPQQNPMHGFARTQAFEVCGVESRENGETILRMILRDSAETREIWPHAFELEAAISLGRTLLVELTARNLGDQPYQYTGALHPYFAVSNVHELTLDGLEETAYIDTNDQCQRKVQTTPVTFPGGIDNIYLETCANLAIQDPGFRRTIHIHKLGSATTVVWNPDREDVVSADVGAGQHQFFICVEAANAAEEIITVEAGGEAHLGMEVEVENWRDP
jgi:glucose-6-phosphate 1-epimerase